MAGRYLQFQIWPLTIGELGKANQEMNAFLRDPLVVSLSAGRKLAATWERWRHSVAFRSLYLNGRAASYRRRSATYGQRVVREEYPRPDRYAR